MRKGFHARIVQSRGVLCALLCLGGACRPELEHKAFFEMLLSERERVFVTYPMETQIDIYLEGVKKVHPPAVGLGLLIAESGERAVGPILSRLATTEDDYEEHYLLYVLGLISCNHYDLSGNEEVIRRAGEAVSTMDRYWRERAAVSLANIRGQQC